MSENAPRLTSDLSEPSCSTRDRSGLWAVCLIRTKNCRRLDFPELLEPKKPVIGASRILPVSRQDRKFRICRLVSTFFLALMSVMPAMSLSYLCMTGGDVPILRAWAPPRRGENMDRRGQVRSRPNRHRL